MTGVRERAARAWLGAMFRLAAGAPGVLDALKPAAMFVVWRCSRRVREATLANAARILGKESTEGERRALARAVISNFYGVVAEFGRNRRASRGALLARIEAVEGLERYERARSMGRGAILVTAHLGPFETAVASLRSREERVHIVFRRDASAAFERLRSEQRRRLGVIEAPIDDGLATWLSLRDALARNEVVLIQGDRRLPGQKGARVPFLGGHLEITDGPVRLALATGAPIVPTFAVRIEGRGGRDGVRILIDEPIMVGRGAHERDPDSALALIAAAIARVVRQYPEQWLVLDKAWVEDQTEGRGAPA